MAGLAKQFPVIRGIVGGLDLTQPPDQLRLQLRACPLLVGVRHILDTEDQDWLARQDVHQGLAVLEVEDATAVHQYSNLYQEEGIPFDCLVRPPTLHHVADIGQIIE